MKKEFKFNFRGMNTSGVCKREKAHTPHIVRSYSTVNHGELQEFCLGKEGKTESGTLHIVVEYYTKGSVDYTKGSANYPAEARGFWWIEPADIEKRRRQMRENNELPFPADIDVFGKGDIK